MSSRRHCSLAAVSAAIAITALSACNSSGRSNEKQVAAAENGVYEAVVRDMTSPANRSSQLVFDEALLTQLAPGADMKSCQESARENLRLENNTPPYNSLVDKLYRFVNGRYDYSIRADTIQDFLEKSCTPGRLSQSFHTDLPKAFINAWSVRFSDLIVNDGSKSFEQLFPGASGIISFSHVGFDSTLHEAIVATSFVCGMLCGSGHRYVLREIRGHWEVVNQWTVWVS